MSRGLGDVYKRQVEISESFDTPVVVRTTMRTSHSKSVVKLGADPAPFGDVGPFTRDMQKYNCMCLWSKQRHPVLEQRLLDLAAFSDTFPWNRIEWGDRNMGIIAGGVIYEYARQVFPDASILKLGMTFPLPKKLIQEFADGVKKIIVIEELDPFIEEQVRAMGISAIGKEIFPSCDELLPQTIQGLAEKHHLLPARTKAAPFQSSLSDLPGRSPVLCAGCPHRSTFFLLNKMKLPVAGDIGCYNLGTLPPFNAQHTMGSMGASIGVLHGMGKSNLPEPAVCTIGDGTFFHAGIPPLLNMVHNHGRGTVIIMDNHTTAMTGHQDHPGNDYTLMGQATQRVDIENIVRSLGVEKVISVDAFDVKAMGKALKECTAYDGTAVLIAKGPCIFVSRNPQPAYMVDADLCIACGTCARVGCPATTKIDEINPKNKMKKAGIDPVLCIGCDICRQVCPTGAIQKPES